MDKGASFARNVELLKGRLLDFRHKLTGDTKDRPVLVGLCAPQGCGKSSLCQGLVGELGRVEGSSNGRMLRAVTISTDDFYLRRDEQRALAEEGNTLLACRGNAGTHDIDLAVRTLKALMELNAHPDTAVKLPRYNKQAFGSLGDRFPEDEWPECKGPIDFVLLEGWNVGFEAFGDDQLDKLVEIAKNLPPSLSESPITPEGSSRYTVEETYNVHDPLDEMNLVTLYPALKILSGCEKKDLVSVNKHQKCYKRLFDMLDCTIHLTPATLEWVYEWRYEQEVRDNGGGKTKEDVTRFVDTFMPGYALGSPKLSFNPNRPAETYIRLDVARDRTLIEL